MKISTRTRPSPTITFTYRSRCNSTIPDPLAIELRSQHRATPKSTLSSLPKSGRFFWKRQDPNREDTPANPRPQPHNYQRQSETQLPGTHSRTLGDRDSVITQPSSSVYHGLVSLFVCSPRVPMRHVLLSSRRPVPSFSVNNSRCINLPSPLLRYRPRFSRSPLCAHEPHR